jgi:predicted nucleic-acid-binding Zn-ribbon protein
MPSYSYQCIKCGTNVADNWVKQKVSNIVEEKKNTLHTVRHETSTVIFCPTCYEEEATNAI